MSRYELSTNLIPAFNDAFSYKQYRIIDFNKTSPLDWIQLA